MKERNGAKTSVSDREFPVRYLKGRYCAFALPHGITGTRRCESYLPPV
jgi:hypothetical protein